MKSKVYFIPVESADDIQDVDVRLGDLLSASGVLDCVKEKNNVVVKVHFGESGNTGFVRPEHLRVICERIKSRGADAFLSDANTLYRGRRLSASDHAALAAEHGFTLQTTRAEVVIPDDAIDAQAIDVTIDCARIKTARIARLFIDADALVIVTHFKGHILTGFGGALKNVGMGCATRAGKLAQHNDIAPVVHAELCTGCAACQKICPAGAITIQRKKSVVSKSKCIGCASCIAACPTMAMFVDFGAGIKVQEKMAEYCLAVLQHKKKAAAFVSFAVRINKECDCWGQDNPRIAPDIGIFASDDPVSIDKACLDMVNTICGRDIFKEHHPEQDGMHQLLYAESIGLGNLDYELIEIKPR